MSEISSKMSRRNIFAAATAGAAGLTGLAALPVQARPAGSPRPLTTPAVEGPYWVADAPIRRNICEGLVGIPARVVVRVEDEAGRPISDARVDLWHADTMGVYSGFASQGDALDVDARGKTYLRGAQITDSEGAVLFDTIFPGWYRSRSTHLHLKISLAGAVVLTTQFYLPDALNEFVYTKAEAYRRTAVRDTLNSTDKHRRHAGPTCVADVRDFGDRYEISHLVRIDPRARPPQGLERFPPGAPPLGRALGLSDPERTQALLPPGARITTTE